MNFLFSICWVVYPNNPFISLKFYSQEEFFFISDHSTLNIVKYYQKGHEINHNTRFIIHRILYFKILPTVDYDNKQIYCKDA